MSEKENAETRAAIVAVTLAISEQLDPNRLLKVIETQFDKAEKLNLPTTCSILGEIGQSLISEIEKRDQKKKP